MTSEDRDIIARYINDLTGIFLEDQQPEALESQLSGLAHDLGCKDYNELTELARNDASQEIPRQIISRITAKDDMFFQDSAQYAWLKSRLFPLLFERLGITDNNNRTPRIRVWSAACSLGQELYSLAILLSDLTGGSGQPEFEVLGSDISEGAIAYGRKGRYTDSELGPQVTDEMKASYFIQDDGHWQISQQLRNQVRFELINLMTAPPIQQKQHLILLRNVGIYYSKGNRVKLFNSLAQRLHRSGVLILGNGESFMETASRFEEQKYHGFSYYELR